MVNKITKKGTKFEVKYASGREDTFFAKTSKHYEQCLKDLAAAKEIGSIVSWREINPKVKEIRYG